ncbi:MAG: hypothetical protein K9M81_04370 [Chthoniobacterales bacterium]|nr:hypothetical protein [Chthoniobacterales bacterium]
MESSSLLRWSRIIIEVGGRDSYSPASQSFARLVLISFAPRLMTIQYEISGLISIAIIFFYRFFLAVIFGRSCLISSILCFAFTINFM